MSAEGWQWSGHFARIYDAYKLQTQGIFSQISRWSSAGIEWIRLQQKDIWLKTQVTSSPTYILFPALLFTLAITYLCILNKKKTTHLLLNRGDPHIHSIYDLAKTAYEDGHSKAVMKLVRRLGFDINYQLPGSGLSLFLCACLSGQRDLIKFLIERGANVDSKTSNGDNALYLATFGLLNYAKADVDLLGDLIEAGCDVNEQNNSGYTPLHRAASKGNTEIIKYLLKHGADTSLQTKSGIYPIDSATSASHIEAAQLLQLPLDSNYVWDIVEPHTPIKARFGLLSPNRRPLVESTFRSFQRPKREVFTH